MKKKGIIITLLSLSIIAVFGYLFYYISLPKTYKEVTYEEYRELVESNEKFVLFIGSATCSHCTTYKKTINRVIEDYHINVYYIDLSKLDEKQAANINSHFPFGGTPTTIVIQNGEEYERARTRIEGSKNYEYTVEKLKNAKIIK